MSFANTTLFLTVSSIEIYGSLARDFLDVAWDYDVSTVKES